MTKKSISNFGEGIGPYMPAGSLEEVLKLIDKYPCQLKITRARKTKLGDFRAGTKGDHKISVNGDLNPFAFLITFVHEYAHLSTFEKFGRRVKPHGAEWKSEFRRLLLPFFSINIFPRDLEKALAIYLKNPKASSGSDINLQRTLMNHDEENDDFLLEDLDPGELFIFRDNRIFKRGEKLRKRIKCLEIATGKNYLFNPLTPIEIFENQTA